jgi:hypothetical protein
MRYRWDPPYPYSTSTHRTRPDDGSGLRASDAERNEVSERLSRHFAEGRLDQVEFKSRLDRAMGAVTRGDLEGLFDDLPRLADDPEPPRPHRRLFLPIVALLILAGAGVSAFYSTIHISWVVVVVVAIFLWHRASRRRSHTHDELHR